MEKRKYFALGFATAVCLGVIISIAEKVRKTEEALEGMRKEREDECPLKECGACEFCEERDYCEEAEEEQ